MKTCVTICDVVNLILQHFCQETLKYSVTTNRVAVMCSFYESLHPTLRTGHAALQTDITFNRITQISDLEPCMKVARVWLEKIRFHEIFFLFTPMKLSENLNWCTVSRCVGASWAVHNKSQTKRIFFKCVHFYLKKNDIK